MLTQEQVKELFYYFDGSLFYRHKGLRTKIGQLVGHENGNGYKRVDVNGKKQYVHRLIWVYFYGDIGDKFVDHIDCNRQNNNIQNLRLVDRSLNGLNRAKARKDSTSGLIGVSSGKTKKGTLQFTAKLVIKGQTIYQKNFKTAEDAHKAYIEQKNKQGILP